MSVSIVIPNYNGRTVLQKHLPAVLAALSKNEEVIVVDDASTDDSIEYLSKEFPQVKIVKNERNMRFAESCNRGVEVAVHEIIVLLNNDVSPEKEFLRHVVPHFENPSVFAVGCLELDDNGQESGRSIGHFERGMLRHMRAPDQTKTTTLWAAGGSMAVRRSLWQKLGGMDRLFRPAYKEDIDLSYRAWKAGYQVLFEPKARVHHSHETTNLQALGSTNILVISYKNEFLFMWKNITDPSLFLLHVFWLCFYILPVLGWKTRGAVLKGFVLAKLQVFEAVRSRSQVKKFWKLKDSEVLQKAGK